MKPGTSEKLINLNFSVEDTAAHRWCPTETVAGDLHESGSNEARNPFALKV